MSSKILNVYIYEIDTESLDGKHQMKVKLLKVNKPELLAVENPQYADPLQGNTLDKDTKSQLPVHVIFGSGDYARIKTDANPRVGKLNVSQYNEDDLNAYGSPVHTTEAAANALPVLPAPIHTRSQVMFKAKLFVAFILVVFGFIK